MKIDWNIEMNSLAYWWQYDVGNTFLPADSTKFIFKANKRRNQFQAIFVTKRNLHKNKVQRKLSLQPPEEKQTTSTTKKLISMQTTRNDSGTSNKYITNSVTYTKHFTILNDKKDNRTEMNSAFGAAMKMGQMPRHATPQEDGTEIWCAFKNSISYQHK